MSFLFNAVHGLDSRHSFMIICIFYPIIKGRNNLTLNTVTKNRMPSSISLQPGSDAEIYSIYDTVFLLYPPCIWHSLKHIEWGRSLIQNDTATKFLHLKIKTLLSRLCYNYFYFIYIQFRCWKRRIWLAGSMVRHVYARDGIATHYRGCEQRD